MHALGDQPAATRCSGLVVDGHVVSVAGPLGLSLPLSGQHTWRRNGAAVNRDVSRAVLVGWRDHHGLRLGRGVLDRASDEGEHKDERGAHGFTLPDRGPGTKKAAMVTLAEAGLDTHEPCRLGWSGIGVAAAGVAVLTGGVIRLVMVRRQAVNRTAAVR